MTFFETMLEVIDMRSFSNLWYWLALAAVWSRTGHYVLGVPFDMVSRAERHGGQAVADLEAAVDIRARRMLFVAERAGLAIVALVAMALTGLMLMGFLYGVEFAQAVFLMALPLTLVRVLALGLARRVIVGGLYGPGLRQAMSRHHLIVQVVGIVSIFVTAMWGMWTNLYVGPLR